MTDCLKHEEQIEMELDGELSTAQRAELNRHLSLCPRCREYKAESLALFAALDSGILIEPPVNLAGPLLATIAKRRAWRMLGIAAALLLTLISLGPNVWQAVGLTINIMLSWEPEWLMTLWTSVWRTVRVLHRAWVMVSSAMPDEYWLGLALMAAINFIMLLKLMGLRPMKGGSSL